MAMFFTPLDVSAVTIRLLDAPIPLMLDPLVLYGAISGSVGATRCLAQLTMPRI